MSDRLTVTKGSPPLRTFPVYVESRKDGARILIGMGELREDGSIVVDADRRPPPELLTGDAERAAGGGT